LEGITSYESESSNFESQRLLVFLMSEEKDKKIRRLLKRDVEYCHQNQAFCFLPSLGLPVTTAGVSVLGKIQNILKQYGSLYYYIINIFAPVFPCKKFRNIVTEQIATHGSEAVILNLGSGPQILKGRNDIINVDIFAFNGVDIMADATDLPIEDDSVDLVISVAMLEHVSCPIVVVDEILRVLKPAGKVLAYVPFMVPFHAAPHDFHRWSKPGLIHLFREYEVLEVGVGAGPTSGMLYVQLEWIAMILSFGSKTVHDLLFLMFMIVCSPIKLLDIFLIKHPNAEKIASGFYILARKMSNSKR